MATRRILTRKQTRDQVAHTKIQPNRKEWISPNSKRKVSSSLQVRVDVDGGDENVEVDVSTTSLNRSYPQDVNDVCTRKKSRKKNDATVGGDTGKRRQTLSDRGVNCVKSPRKEKVVEDHDRIADRTESPILFDTPREETSSEKDEISQDEITKLVEETPVVEEMVCEENMATAHADFSCLVPRFYRTPYPFDVPVDTHMDTDPWRSMGTHGKVNKRLPRGVIDIDAGIDPFNTNIYSDNIFDYLRQKELQYSLPFNFLETNKEVTPRMRAVLMDWLIQVQTHEDLEEDTLHMCVALVDRYLSIAKIRVPRLQLLGITSLLIASKFLERFAPEISTLCYLTAHTFRQNQVVKYELHILTTLAFDLSMPVPTTFLRRYLQVHEKEQPQEVTSLAFYLLDLSIISAKMATMLPSELAASAVYLARRLVLGNSHAWTPSLTYYTPGYTPTELSDTVVELAHLLYKAPSSKYQGVRHKYNNEQHCFISTSEITAVGSVEAHFTTPMSSV